jgi:hypothetical protein
VHENETILENSGGGGPYDLMIDGLMVTTDGDGVVHVASRGRPIAIDTESFGVGLQAFYDPRI